MKPSSCAAAVVHWPRSGTRHARSMQLGHGSLLDPGAHERTPRPSRRSRYRGPRRSRTGHATSFEPDRDSRPRPAPDRCPRTNPALPIRSVAAARSCRRSRLISSIPPRAGDRVAAPPRIRDHVTPSQGHALATTTTTSTRSLAAVILAAGKGKRLKSARPKVLHPICGKPALWHVIQAALGAKPTKIVVVVGHAAAVAERAVGRSADVLVLGGDYDPITSEDVATLVRTHRRKNVAATIATAEVDDPGGYGRVIRDGDRLVGIVEHADATPAQRAINEVWLVATAFRREDLFRALPLVGDE